MDKTSLARVGVIVLVLALAGPAAAQEFRGRVNGVVTDNTGAVLPGVTVTATSPALIQPQVVVTDQDGAYRLIALPAGVYTLTFELAGFKTLRREGIRVVINTTLPVDAQLEIAALEETVTVSGESPVVDTSTTSVGTNFTKELLTEIPNARDVWAAMSQAPGFQMTGYDVGGSHTGTQTGYLTYGFGGQNTTRIEGVNTSEGTSANAGYFDFGSFEEFQLGGAGNMADQDVPDASLNITVKSGGDRFSGMWYSDWEGARLISDNVPDELKVAGGRTSEGYFVRDPLQRGNPIDRQYDINANVGGPVWRGKAWFFYSYRLNDQYKYVLNFDELARSKLTNLYTLKTTYQLSRNNQLIGFINKREKLQALRNLGPTTPVSAAFYQSSRNYPVKVEWTSVLSDRAFLDVLVARWTNYFPLRPTTESGAFPEDRFQPGRIELTSSQYFDGGANSSYQDQKRYKPQVAVSLAYFKSGWHGSHDFKLGYEWHRDRRAYTRDQPFDIFYRDRNSVPVEVDLYNTPVDPINDVNAHAAYVNDTWKFGSRLTLNLGLRMDRYKDGWPEQKHTPNGLPALRNATDPTLLAFFAPRTVGAKTVARTLTWGPRAGFAYDLRGDNRSVIKGFYGRFYFNSADTIADNENPVGRAQLRYQFLDANGNRVLDGPQELGRLLSTVGGAGFVRVDPNLERPYGQEISAHFEQEIVAGLSGRFSYVYKNRRNEWNEVDLIRVSAYTIPVQRTDPGPDGVTGTGDDKTLSLLDRPAATASDRVFTNPTDPADESDGQSIELALNRRFKDKWMALAAFGYSRLDQFHGVTSSTSVLGSAGVGRDYNWRPNQRLFGREVSTFWNYKIIGRYVMPLDIGVSGSWKVQSGRNWGRSLSVALTGAGTETIRVEPIDTRRAPTVSILDLRVDKSFQLPGGGGRLVGMVDVFNVLNADTVTNFRITGGSRFQEVIALLDPRIVRLGVRWEF